MTVLKPIKVKIPHIEIDLEDDSMAIYIDHQHPKYEVEIIRIELDLEDDSMVIFIKIRRSNLLQDEDDDVVCHPVRVKLPEKGQEIDAVFLTPEDCV